MSEEKYIGHGRSPGNDLRCRYGLQGQADYGMHPGDESGHDSSPLWHDRRITKRLSQD
jgi:hypothetical protein